MTDNDIPAPPARLLDDKRLLNRDIPQAWERRRTNKMRERFPVTDHQPLQGLSLIAPVQPSIAYKPFNRTF